MHFLSFTRMQNEKRSDLLPVKYNERFLLVGVFKKYEVQKRFGQLVSYLISYMTLIYLKRR